MGVGLVATGVVGAVLGQLSFRVSLPFAPDPASFGLVFLGLTTLSGVATLGPARRVTSGRIVEALATVE